MNYDKDIEFGLQINELEKYLEKKNIAFIGLSDTIGYSPNGYNYLDRISHSMKIRARNLAIFNAHFRTLTSEHHIEDLIASNVSIKDIKRIQSQETDDKVLKILEDKHLPNDKKLLLLTKSCLRLNEAEIYSEDRFLRLRDVIQDYDDVNIFYSANMGFINKSSTPECYIEKEMEQRKRNYEYILSLNPKAEIYAIGLICPNKNKKDMEKTNKLNEFYQELSSSFGTIYIAPEKDIEKALKKENSTYYLTGKGIDPFAFRCIEAMYNQKILKKNGTRTNPSTSISTPSMKNNNSIDYLLKKSIERVQALEKAFLKETDKHMIDFLIQTIKKEIEQQKMYTHVKTKKKTL